MANILLVEDEESISEPFGIVLRTAGYQVDIAVNGLEALDLFKKNKYDLIMLDIMMPLCDGIEFLEKADVKSTAPGTKVIMLSNLSNGKEIDAALKLGASRSLLKANITPKILIQEAKKEIGD